MNKVEFLSRLKEDLEVINEEITENTVLADLSVWDSMSSMVIISLIDELFEVTITSKDFGQITTVQSLMELVGEEKFE